MIYFTILSSDEVLRVLKMMGEWLDQCYIERNSDFLNRVKDFAANVRGQGNRVLEDLKSQLTAVVDRRVRWNNLSPSRLAKYRFSLCSWKDPVH